MLSTVPREIAAVVAIAALCMLLTGGCLWLAAVAVDAAIPPALAMPIGVAAGIKTLGVIVLAMAFIVLSAGLVIMRVWRARRKFF